MTVAATVVASVIDWDSLFVFDPAVELPFSVERYMLSYTWVVFLARFGAPLVEFVVGSVGALSSAESILVVVGLLVSAA